MNMVNKSGKWSRQSDLEDSKGSTESTNNVSKLNKIFEIVGATKNDVLEIKLEIVDIKSSLEFLKFSRGGSRITKNSPRKWII